MPSLLEGRWELSECDAAVTTPAALDAAAPAWRPIPGPIPVAAALRENGVSLEGRDLDGSGWWYRCRFPAPPGWTTGIIRFEGLATLADVWLDRAPMLRSESMFLPAETPPFAVSGAEHELLVFCRPLAGALAQQQPRPRWRTALVASQNLRWHRTALLGRIRSWCPPIAPVGPWKPVQLLDGNALRPRDLNLRATLGDDGAGRLGVRLVLDGPVEGLETATVHVAGAIGTLSLERRDGRVLASGELGVPGIDPWWPHTHGAQPLYPVEVRITLQGRVERLPLGRVGFRTVTVDRGADGRGFGLVVNGVPVFCRGACWSPLDLHRLHGTPSATTNAVGQARRAGMNMLRVGGTMVYESEAFYDACDAQGILVWQDFMLANLDYPATPAFLDAVRREAVAVTSQLAGRPSLAVLCGSSELEQQAAMLGLPAETWSHHPVLSTLGQTVAEEAPHVAWIGSSPSGGALPFHTDAGVTHYYGVGAYRRPFEDARYAAVRFASECLAFSHVGAEEGNPGAADWKAGVPRDPGAEWDFEEVRDHYLERLFGADPVALRRQAPDRYLALGRVTTGEVITRVIGEWRRPGSSCRGALVWFLRDLAPGAGWGLVSVDGRPKPAWWYARRAFAPVALLATDEGLNGWHLHAVNDTALPVDATLQVAVYRDGRTPIARGSAAVSLPPRRGVTTSADAILPGFVDLTYAYRFGPPGHNLLAARLVGADGAELGSVMHWPIGMPVAVDPELRIQAAARRCGRDVHLTLSADRATIGVELVADGYTPDDNWLSLAPGTPRTVVLRADDGADGSSVGIRALNAAAMTVPVGSP